jgi:hypothetical protein
MSHTKFNKGSGKNKLVVESERLGISEQTLMRLYLEGVVPATKVSKRIILFDPAATDAALTKRDQEMVAGVKSGQGIATLNGNQLVTI